MSTTDPAFIATCGNITSSCTLSIAVYGFTRAQFQIIAYTAFERLAAGVPIVGASAGRQFRYYAFVAENPDPFSIVVTPLSGDPDL